MTIFSGIITYTIYATCTNCGNWWISFSKLSKWHICYWIFDIVNWLLRYFSTQTRTSRIDFYMYALTSYVICANAIWCILVCFFIWVFLSISLGMGGYGQGDRWFACYWLNNQNQLKRMKDSYFCFFEVMTRDDSVNWHFHTYFYIDTRKLFCLFAECHWMLLFVRIEDHLPPCVRISKIHAKCRYELDLCMMTLL